MESTEKSEQDRKYLLWNRLDVIRVKKKGEIHGMDLVYSKEKNSFCKQDPPVDPNHKKEDRKY